MIYKHFANDPVKFEHMAAEIWVTMDPNVDHVEVTRPSRDGGRDAIGTYRIGPGKDPISLEFALEAKCYAPDHGVGVRDVARLISRIRHRQFGVFVTTSFIGQQVYKEVREDGHPVAFISGADIVSSVRRMGYESPATLEEYLQTRHPIGSAASGEVVDDLVYPAEVSIAIGQDSGAATTSQSLEERPRTEA
ncbi:restriction endonuclease [Dietzia maris]|uniref:restriction endonuclease n=1 Tax=Dietzia maris TaxID=37915 RepID=UPI003430E96C